MATQLMAPTSELDAINEMLSAIGESLLDNLDDVFADAAVAQKLLVDETRALQNGQWTFNTEAWWTLSPAADGTITVPQNVLRVLQPNAYLVQRGSKLYDRRNHTFVFPTGTKIECDLIVALTFDQLPEAARRFIFVRSARKFQDRLQADGALHQMQEKDEMQAWSALLNYEAEVAGWNQLQHSELNRRMKLFRASSFLVDPLAALGRD